MKLPDEKEIADFIHAQTVPQPASAVPEVRLYLASEVTPLWHLTEERLKNGGAGGEELLPPPYWAFAWPGGQGLARYALDHPETVRGKRVLDFASGCGIGAIAAMKAGAQKAFVADIDLYAQVAAQLNAEMNGVVVENALPDLDKPYRQADIILAGDVCYQQAMSARILRWLYLCVGAGIKVLLGDPGRAYVPHTGLIELARYDVPVSRDLEDRDVRTAIVWDLQVPEAD
jgi:predicted nicotinamide N-methyase